MLIISQSDKKNILVGRSMNVNKILIITILSVNAVFTSTTRDNHVFLGILIKELDGV